MDIFFILHHTKAFKDVSLYRVKHISDINEHISDINVASLYPLQYNNPFPPISPLPCLQQCNVFPLEILFLLQKLKNNVRYFTSVILTGAKLPATTCMCFHVTRCQATLCHVEINNNNNNNNNNNPAIHTPAIQFCSSTFNNKYS